MRRDLNEEKEPDESTGKRDPGEGNSQDGGSESPSCWGTWPTKMEDLHPSEGLLPFSLRVCEG